MRKLLATLFIALGLSGAVAAMAPAASADPGLIQKIVVIIDPAGAPHCVYVDVTLFGHLIGTGYPGICAPA